MKSKPGNYLVYVRDQVDPTIRYPPKNQFFYLGDFFSFFDDIPEKGYNELLYIFDTIL